MQGILTEAQAARSELARKFPSQWADADLEKARATIPKARWDAFTRPLPHLAETVVFGSGRMQPYADTKQEFEDGSTLIELYDGLAAYLKAIARTVAASFRSNDKTLGVHATALRPGDVDATLLQLFQSCTRMWKEKRFDPPAIALSPQAEQLADLLYNAALVFTAMHEYGHAVLHRGSNLDKPTKEFQADAWAAQAFITQYAPSVPLNVAVAGALLYLRAITARREILPDLAQNGAPLKYPPSSQRFSALVKMFCENAEYKLQFFIKTTFTFAIDMRLQAAERALTGRPGTSPSEPEQFTSMIVGGLIEIFENRMTHAELERQLEAVLSSAPPGLFQQTLVLCLDIFSKEQRSYQKLPDVRRLTELASPALEFLTKHQ